jgi:hypothetical protein
MLIKASTKILKNPGVNLQDFSFLGTLVATRFKGTKFHEEVFVFLSVFET